MRVLLQTLGVAVWLSVACLPALAALPAPSPPPAADPCGGETTNVLATIDRPTIGFSACAVKTHQWLDEYGYANEQRSDGTRAVTYPQGIERYGLLPNVELDAIGPAFGVNRDAAALAGGWFDSGLGAKVEVAHTARNVFGFDLLYTAPTGSPGFSAGAPTYTLNLDASHALSPAISLATTIGFASAAGQNAGSTQRYGTLLPSVVVTDAFDAQTQVYLEAYGATHTAPGAGGRFALDGGIQFMLNPQFEIDAELGQSLTDVARSHYFGFGIGLRL